MNVDGSVERGERALQSLILFVTNELDEISSHSWGTGSSTTTFTTDRTHSKRKTKHCIHCVSVGSTVTDAGYSIYTALDCVSVLLNMFNF